MPIRPRGDQRRAPTKMPAGRSGRHPGTVADGRNYLIVVTVKPLISKSLVLNLKPAGARDIFGPAPKPCASGPTRPHPAFPDFGLKLTFS